ncbi:hypothetical protein JKP88DRAFT_200402 [Tribonema minus]|uniref:Uncharacterized protein n=1 Tax=Tribonema minus TaxID=303371 RepID=A0A836CDY9_9STRA|nr:hypothetical protein JKP88DRAFT_200402 [Tribonema minus]
MRSSSGPDVQVGARAFSPRHMEGLVAPGDAALRWTVTVAAGCATVHICALLCGNHQQLESRSRCHHGIGNEPFVAMLRAHTFCWTKFAAYGMSAGRRWQRNDVTWSTWPTAVHVAQ